MYMHMCTRVDVFETVPESMDISSGDESGPKPALVLALTCNSYTIKLTSVYRNKFQ